MEYWKSEVWSVAPKAVWLLMSLGIVLAAETAAALSLVFLAFTLPWLYNGSASPSLLLPSLVTMLVAPFVGLLVGLPTWWRFVAKPNKITLRRGVVLGALSGVVAHPLMWLCILLPLGLGLIVVIPASILSLVFFGWITAAVGAVAGGLLVYFQRELMRRPGPQDAPVSLAQG